MPSKLPSAIAASLTLVLAGCLGGGGGGTPASSTAGPGGNTGASGTPTPPVRVQGLNVIHLEMTDPFWHYPEGTNVVVSTTDSGDQQVDENFRFELVCPGIPPGGNECIAEVSNIDGTKHAIDSRDYSVATFHADVLKDVTLGNLDASSMFGTAFLNSVDFWYKKHGASACKTFRGTDCEPGDHPQSFGGKGQHSIFYSHAISSSERSDGVSETFAAAMGYLSDGRPERLESETGATATWSGGMVGRDIKKASPLVGDAEVEFSFAANTVDVRISKIRKTTISGFESFGDYNGPEALEWAGLRVNADASFYIPGFGNHKSDTDLHPVYGYIDGDFYGANAEEVAGVFERAGVSGAWLAIRNMESAPGASNRGFPFCTPEYGYDPSTAGFIRAEPDRPGSGDDGTGISVHCSNSDLYLGESGRLMLRWYPNPSL